MKCVRIRIQRRTSLHIRIQRAKLSGEHGGRRDRHRVGHQLAGSVGGQAPAGATLEETREVIREAIEFHIDGMRSHGEEVPPPTGVVEQVEVAA
jgi:hypothetical protein